MEYLLKKKRLGEQEARWALCLGEAIYGHIPSLGTG